MTSEILNESDKRAVLRRKISSRLTLTLKVLPPLVFTTASIIGLVSIFIDPSTLSDDGIVGIVTLIGMTVICYWWSGRLRTVSVSEKSLYVSNWRKEILIPLTNVEYIYYFGAGHAVIRLKSLSEFGRSINFLVPLRLLEFNLSHPVVEELRETVKSQRG